MNGILFTDVDWLRLIRSESEEEIDMTEMKTPAVEETVRATPSGLRRYLYSHHPVAFGATPPWEGNFENRGGGAADEGDLYRVPLVRCWKSSTVTSVDTTGAPTLHKTLKILKIRPTPAFQQICKTHEKFVLSVKLAITYDTIIALNDSGEAATKIGGAS
jgi:hypothetical protein